MSDLISYKQFFRIICMIFTSYIWNGSIIAQDVITYSTFEDFSKDFIRDKDTTYVINFWATWCKPCVKELPYFEALHNKTKNEKIKIILVSLDFKKQKETHLIPFLYKNKLNAQVVLLADSDYNRWLSKVDEDWSGSIPATWLILGNRMQFAEQEFDNTEQLYQFVNNFISSP